MLKELFESQEWKIMLNDSNINPVFVYCSASWCVPCKTFKPEFIKMTEQHTLTQFFLVDVDDLSDEVIEVGVSSVPVTLKIFRGEVISRVNGPHLDKIEDML